MGRISKVTGGFLPPSLLGMTRFVVEMSQDILQAQQRSGPFHFKIPLDNNKKEYIFVLNTHKRVYFVL